MSLFSNKKSKSLKKGKLVVLCGQNPETTAIQERLLIEALQFSDFEIGTVNFPSATSRGAMLLKEFEKSPNVGPHAIAIFRSTDRFEARDSLEKLLSSGVIVITTDYTITNAAGGGERIADERERVSFYKWTHNIEHEVFKLPKPDLNIIFSPPVTVPTNEESINPYAELARLYPKTKILPTSFKGSRYTDTEIHNTVWHLIRRIVLKDYKI